MSDLHREKTTSVTQEYSRRHEKATLQSGGAGSQPRADAHRAGAATRPLQPMRCNLADLASIAFKDYSWASIKVGLIRGLWCFLEGYISKGRPPGGRNSLFSEEFILSLGEFREALEPPSQLELYISLA